jgi:hypothetical protein
VPDRHSLPPLARYAKLRLPDGTTRVVGYTEATRGCKHRCRHCPVVPVYDGRFRVVPIDVVLADVAQQVAQGAGHVTFGDPDFFNGIGHAERLLEAFARRFPGITYDVTIKVEHLLRHAALLPVLRRTGCLFVTTAVESLDDAVLARLEKGHTRQDFERLVPLMREAGLPLAPTFIPFTPWTTAASYRDLLATIERLDLAGHVPPIQLTLRLLVPEGSRLLELGEVRSLVGPFDAAALVHPWRHPDPGIDDLQREAAHLVAARDREPRETVFQALSALAARTGGATGRTMRTPRDAPRPRTDVPYLDEPWYC